MIDVKHRDELLRVVGQISGVFLHGVIRIQRVGHLQNHRLANVLLQQRLIRLIGVGKFPQQRLTETSDRCSLRAEHRIGPLILCDGRADRGIKCIAQRIDEIPQSAIEPAEKSWIERRVHLMLPLFLLVRRQLRVIAEKRKHLLLQFDLIKKIAGFPPALWIDIGMVVNHFHAAAEDFEPAPQRLAAIALHGDAIAPEKLQALVARPLGQHRSDDRGDEDDQQREVKERGRVGTGILCQRDRHFAFLGNSAAIRQHAALQGDFEPGGVVIWIGFDVAQKRVAIDKCPPIRLIFIKLEFFAIVFAKKNVIEFVFGDFRVEIRAIDKRIHLAQLGFDPTFLPKPPLRCHFQILSPSRMRAAGIGPQPAEMIFPMPAQLQKHLVFRVKNEDAERPVQFCRPAMRCQLLNRPKRAILLIDQNDLLVLRRHVQS